MKLFGHPVHPLMIHFPTALLPMELLFLVMYYYEGNASFGIGAFYCLAAAVLVGLLAMVTGLIDLLNVPKKNKAALSMALYHAFLNGVIILIYAVILFREWQVYPDLESPTMSAIIFRGILILLLFIGNYLGGTLIYKHHIGIKPQVPDANN